MKLPVRIFDIEPKYYEECSEKGKVERIDYHTVNYDGAEMDKYAFVYTPYGYDPQKKYEILYLIHGGGEDAEKYLFKDGEENKLKRAIDNMIADKEIEPVIIVTPSPYPYNKIASLGLGHDNDFTSYFHNEMINDLLPAVEAKYHTYSDLKVDEQSLKAARDHRYTMGWSMGCVTTWFTFLHRLDYFRHWGFMSMGCREIEKEHDIQWAHDTGKLIVEAIKEKGYDKKDFDMIEMTGTLDKAYDTLVMQTGALFAYPDYFDFYSEDKNACFLTWPGGEHHTQWRLQYTINIIKAFFGRE